MRMKYLERKKTQTSCLMKRNGKQKLKDKNDFKCNLEFWKGFMNPRYKIQLKEWQRVRFIYIKDKDDQII